MTEEMEVYEDDLTTIVLIDEDDNEHEFDFIDMLEVDGKRYAVLEPIDEEDDEAVILRIEEDEEGAEMLYDIEDDAEWEKVVEVWNRLVDEAE